MNKKLLAVVILFCSLQSYSQKKELLNTPPATTKTDNSKTDERTIKPESAVTTNGAVMINGQRISYTATAGTMPVWDADNKIAATLFYTYYQRTDGGDKAKRPLVISFNGGPGSASVWMHIAYTGPKVLKIDDEGYPVQPYGIKDNPYSILDVADIVYIDPVNTGYSRIVDKDTKMKFFGVNADIKYLAEWINTFVTETIVGFHPNI